MVDMKSVAAVFPGQGSQAVGMGKDLAENWPVAAAAFRAVDDSLGNDLSRLCWEGPEEELTLTKNAQPALLVHSVAVHRIVRLCCISISAPAVDEWPWSF